ncbi:activating gamma subunit of the AMP-activated Snf1p kinase complex [Saitoella complicata NRRL Y-17804]|uniref:activating gamma subunit of the AMP-activated Snf1p kinase complex n=1 Tax=Saitoella complicata (strain BCRC 22490 / CBS 7301 / JCM 7358 / NBRC 10748 / NRRL Y-17804) TaxID=698492 RepID=UPI0008679244|nr:activating gamma subunit of the AMP-activated Snf1p kinase complex [Saitoella complicata NRRL Y-17804]ODQ55123.1 activating gamma subunit of the AMP-activated Snf1p kinase complex [Saitoella complicata NRRL Y-17804]
MRDGQAGLEAIRSFIKARNTYDVLPVSFRLIVLDTALLVKKALAILMQNNIVSAPLWDSSKSKFAGLLTASDFLNVIQYYYQNTSYPQALSEIESFRLDGLRDVEKRIGAPSPETLSVNPMKSLYKACQMMSKTHARRIPLIDYDDETGKETVLSVLTQYRILKFIALNCKETRMLGGTLKELGIGRYHDLATATMETPVHDVIQQLVRREIAALPIVDTEGHVLNVYEAVDALALIRAGDYHDLELSVAEAIARRSEWGTEFAGVHTCTEHDTLAAIFETIRRQRLHRLIVVSEGEGEEGGVLIGIVTLSDIMSYIMGAQGGVEKEKERKEGEGGKS